MFVSIFDKDVEASAELLGGKGYGLWFMQQQGINVPPALIIPVSYCVEYMQSTKQAKAVMKEIEKNLPKVYEFFQAKFGYMPLVSVRSGARVSMPGSMDTILNVGLDGSTMSYWVNKLGGDCCMDSYHRLITMYGNVVNGFDRKLLEGAENLPAALKEYQKLANSPFPGANAQLLTSIEAVFQSWNNERAQTYRKLHNIPEDWGTAVVIQAMVFGNLNDQSGTGVLFTRDPDSGAAKVTGEFLVNAQGEDVVAGIRTPMKLREMDSWNPAVFKELNETVLKLEEVKRDVQDVEFTVQDGKLYILQTRNAKRSAKAAVRIAVDMHLEGVLTREQALKRVSAREFDLAQKPVIDPKFDTPAYATGIPACSGVVTGVIVRSAADALDCKKPCILVTEETNPDDIGGMVKAVGVLTMTGGATSHAAVVARSMNKPCVVGLSLEVDKFQPGNQISIDGATGRVWFGSVPVIDSAEDEYIARFKNLIFQDERFAVFSKPDQKLAGKSAVLHFHDLLGVKDLAKVIKARAEEVETLYLDLTGFSDPHVKSYNELFCLTPLTTLSLLKDLKGLPGNVVTIGLSVGDAKHLAAASDFQALLLTKGDLLYCGGETELVKRVLELKAAAGEKVMKFGSVNEGGLSFVSKEKLIVELLG